jgi:tetratricopeptide (TPR) repeat protein
MLRKTMCAQLTIHTVSRFREWRSQAIKLNMKKEITMKVIHFLAGLSLSVLLAACAAFQGAGDIAQGREAMFAGNYKAALSHFQGAEQVDPNYRYANELQEGPLSYLGRAQYLTGNYAQARPTLEKALSQDKGDNIARLYLGLTLARQGEGQKGLQDIDAGMKGIYDFVDYITETFRFSYGRDWDPGRDIRSSIERDRAMIASGKIDWPTLIADGESIAMKIEQEPDIVRRDREEFRRRGFRL